MEEGVQISDLQKEEDLSARGVDGCRADKLQGDEPIGDTSPQSEAISQNDSILQSREKDELHHNMVLPELDTGATHDHTAPAADTMQSVAAFENASVLTQSRGDEKHSESLEQAHAASIGGYSDLQGL